jgi:hypothetical protein
VLELRTSWVWSLQRAVAVASGLWSCAANTLNLRADVLQLGATAGGCALWAVLHLHLGAFNFLAVQWLGLDMECGGTVENPLRVEPCCRFLRRQLPGEQLQLVG